MSRIFMKNLLLPLFGLLGLLGVPSAGIAKAHYDVSYLWHSDSASVLDYRKQVARILGPAVARKLKVVVNDDLFGLVYHRRGDSVQANKVAKTHTRLLRSRGLEAAAAVRSQDWTLFDNDSMQQVKSSAVEVTSIPRSTRSKIARDREISDIEAAVENYIKRLRQQGKIADDERTGWSVYDFTTGEKLVTINEDVQFQAASLVKPFIAAAFFHKVKQGELVYGSKSRRHMERMIRHSDNGSTNWITRQVGGPAAVERILKQRYPKIFRDTHLVEYIPANGRTYRNKASVHDYSRFLYAVWTEAIAGAEEIKRLMSMTSTDRIYSGARDVPKKGTRVYNKTGSTARVCGDMGILSVKGRDGKRYPYTVIGVIEKQQSASNYTTWIRSRSDIIRNVSNIVYRGIAQQHAL